MIKIICALAVILCTLIMVPCQLFADIPAPPVNQTIGINDGVYSDMTEADCRLCHENPDQFPVDDKTVPDRHHLLYGTEIPDSTDAPNGSPGELFNCLSCHGMDNSTGTVQFVLERDCTICHTQDSFFELTVHHRTDLALGNLPQGPDCKFCHGSIVDNMEDGHWIPDYEPSLVTPRPSGGDGLPLNIEGNGAGACDYCHSTGTGNPSVPGTDNDTGILVYSNEDTHHETGFWGGLGAHGFVCYWCHDTSFPSGSESYLQIRVCENCHGRDSLHNIQVDSDGDGIISPGVELPGYGHIGDPDECWGCHGFSMSTEPPSFGPIIPGISSISKSVLTAGANETITLTGSAFINIYQESELTSSISLSGDNGSSIDLTPVLLTESSMTVVIPGTLDSGNYLLRAVKLDKSSNPVVISIKPDVMINHVNCDEEADILTISGSGFGDTPPEETEAYINVKVNGISAEITSWTDTEIQALVTSYETLAVNALFGSSNCEKCNADFDNNTKVDIFDLVIMKNEFSSTDCDVNPCFSDCNEDNSVDIFDLMIMKNDYTKNNCCP